MRPLLRIIHSYDNTTGRCVRSRGELDAHIFLVSLHCLSLRTRSQLPRSSHCDWRIESVVMPQRTGINGQKYDTQGNKATRHPYLEIDTGLILGLRNRHSVRSRTTRRRELPAADLSAVSIQCWSVSGDLALHHIHDSESKQLRYSISNPRIYCSLYMRSSLFPALLNPAKRTSRIPTQ